MAASSGTGRSGARRAFTMVILAALVLAAALTGAWVYLARELDRQAAGFIEAAAAAGTAIDCPGRDVFGYPFRIGLACDAVGIDDTGSGLRAGAGALRTAAQIYRPSRIVAELDGPLVVDAPDLPPLDLRWDLLQASTSLSADGAERLSLNVDAPVVSLRQPAADRLPVASAANFQLHARRNAGDLDLALSDRGVRVVAPAVGELPPFDLAADLSLLGAADWLGQGLPGGGLEEALRGRAGTLRNLSLTLEGGGAAEISGPFEISDAGEISGAFRVAVADPQAISDLVGRLVPEAGTVASAIASGLGFAARQEEGRSVIDVEVRDGEASLGFIPLGRIPPIGG